MTREIALAALVQDDRLLLAHRHAKRRWYPDCWDLIGGHLEPRESPQDAVRRECREEIGVDISELRPIAVDLGDLGLRAYAFLVLRWDGQAVNAAPEEHDALGWFSVEELISLKLAHPRYPSWLPSVIDTAKAR